MFSFHDTDFQRNDNCKIFVRQFFTENDSGCVCLHHKTKNNHTMRRRIILCTIVLLGLAFAGLNLNKTKAMTSLLLENAEALADDIKPKPGEGETYTTVCFADGQLICPIDQKSCGCWYTMPIATSSPLLLKQLQEELEQEMEEAEKEDKK